MKAKIFKLKGLNYYVVNVFTKEQASATCIKCRAGVLPDNLSEVEHLDPSAEVIYDGVLNKKFSKDDFNKYHIYNEPTNDFVATHEYYEDVL